MAVLDPPRAAAAPEPLPGRTRDWAPAAMIVGVMVLALPLVGSVPTWITLTVAALAMGMADKAVSLFYELRLHSQVSDQWVARCKAQIDAVLAVLEEDRAARPTGYWFGESIGHADIAVAVALRHLNDSHPGLIDMAVYPALSAHAARLEAMPVFQEVSQPFIPPS